MLHLPSKELAIHTLDEIPQGRSLMQAEGSPARGEHCRGVAYIRMKYLVPPSH